MNDELSEFERSVRREIDAFMKPGKAATPLPTAPAGTGKREAPVKARGPGETSADAYRTGHLVRLAVRTRKLETDTVFEHRSTSISKLEAQLEAEKAAKKAGYPIIGHVIDIKSL
ncbi:hypothetical protein [Halomonas sp. E14]|uniref:hypothetical protein n=1 Tax=Halomonas sp. E14 TaxID=3397245 RepID=UPI00403E603E